jgi:hypothetical protein
MQFADAGDVITKPYRRQELASKLRGLLGLKVPGSQLP